MISALNSEKYNNSPRMSEYASKDGKSKVWRVNDVVASLGDTYTSETLRLSFSSEPVSPAMAYEIPPLKAADARERRQVNAQNLVHKSDQSTGSKKCRNTQPHEPRSDPGKIPHSQGRRDQLEQPASEDLNGLEASEHVPTQSSARYAQAARNSRLSSISTDSQTKVDLKSEDAVPSHVRQHRDRVGYHVARVSHSSFRRPYTARASSVKSSNKVRARAHTILRRHK